MEQKNSHIYEDIARRTGGDIYIGVVGPVRTGKSTLIKRFIEQMVLPNIEDPAWRDRRHRRAASILGGAHHYDDRAQICPRGSGADHRRSPVALQRAPD